MANANTAQNFEEEALKEIGLCNFEFVEKVTELAKECGQQFMLINMSNPKVIDDQDQAAVGLMFNSTFKRGDTPISPYIDTIHDLAQLGTKHPEALDSYYAMYQILLTMITSSFLGSIAYSEFKSLRDDENLVALNKRVEIGDMVFEFCKQFPSALNALKNLNELEQLDLNKIPKDELAQKVRDVVLQAQKFTTKH